MHCGWAVDATIECNTDSASIIEAAHTTVRRKLLALGASPGADPQELLALNLGPFGAVSEISARIEVFKRAVWNRGGIAKRSIRSSHLFGALAGCFSP